MMLISGASEALNVLSQANAAKAQNKAISRQTQDAYNQIAVQQTAETNDRLRATRKEQARMRVAAGEAGLQLSSRSLEQMLLDSQMQTGLAMERSSLNADNQRSSVAAQANSMYSNVDNPSLLGSGLRIATAAYSGFQYGRGLELSRPKSSEKAADMVKAGQCASKY